MVLNWSKCSFACRMMHGVGMVQDGLQSYRSVVYDVAEMLFNWLMLYLVCLG